MIISELFEAPQQCPECGGISFSNLILAEKKDACYYKVKASAKVWPSAYASGRLVQCRKKGAGNYGNKSESVAEGKADYNFDIEDLKRLERIRDLATLKAQALALISKPSAKPMKPEKVEWFKNALENMNSPMKVIKLMYDLLLSGEGNAVVGTRSSMNPNSYRQRFGEQGMAEEQELDEKWSQKYKSSINCANPRGFSQKAHCAGRNKNEDVEEEYELAGVGVAYKLGRQAYRERKTIRDNPYSATREARKHDEWEKGLERGKHDANDAKLFRRSVGEQGVAEGQLEMNTPDPVVVVQDLKGKILDKINLSVAAQKYKLGQPQNIKNQLAHQNYTKVGNYMIVSPMSGQPQDATTQGVAETELDEKSVSQAQFRTMAGAAHDPKFARKVGISQDVAQEFNRADKKSNYKKLPARATEGEQQPGADYRDPKEVDYDDEYDAMVARVKKLAGLGPMKTVYDPAKRVYRNVPTAVQSPKK